MISRSKGYKIGFMIGKSNNTECFLAKKDDKTYCLKITKFNEHVENELKILHLLKKHKNIISYKESFLLKVKLEDRICIVTEAMNMNLEQYLKINKGRIDESRCRLISGQLLDALNYCHLNLVTHQDLKLQNLMIDPTTLTIKLIDFGLSSKSGSEEEIKKLTQYNGSPLYTSPEKLSMKIYDGNNKKKNSQFFLNFLLTFKKK